MYTFQLPSQRLNACQAKLDQYKDQTDDLLQTTQQLQLAYELVRDYSQADAIYYLEMYNWMNSRYDYVVGYSLTFIP